MHPPLPEAATRFGLLLRRLKVQHGAAPWQEMDAETTLGLLHRCATSEEERRALRAFTPLISRGFLGLLHRSTPERAEIARSIARHVTLRPERLEQIASRIAPLVSVAPTSAIEALALAQGSRRTQARQPPPYNANLWLGVMSVLAATGAGLVLMAYGARRGLVERGAAGAVAPSVAVSRASAPSPAPAGAPAATVR
jgi:hypothetical protein